MKRGLLFIALLLFITALSLTACIPTNGGAGGTNTGGSETGDGGAEPESPGGPEAPEAPEEPENPDGPEAPEEPEVPEEPEAPEEPEVPEEPEQPAELTPVKVYLVGDSTVCAFSDAYYYPRYGYGTQLSQYLSDKATVINLALSGRSSKSFISEDNYLTLRNSLSEGDYLIIGFGHNDEKSDEAARFTDASLPYTEEGSFGYYLNEYYLKLAEEKGAVPILCTPIVRAKSGGDYSGSAAHVTETGDYAQAIRDLGAALGVQVVDLTAITKAEYTSKGYETAKLYHAVTAGKLDTDGITVVPNFASVDNTHLNIYGAKYVAYSLANALREKEGIGAYVKAEITAPTVQDLVPNPDYVYTGYEAPDLESYTPVTQFSTETDGWYGTAFGDTGGDPKSSSNGYLATETAEGVFRVGQTAGSNKGKFSSSADGFAFLFRQIEADKNFTLTVTATVVTTASTKQAGFGIMLRDDVYLPIKDASITSNYLTAGILCEESSTMALFKRENSTLSKGQSFASGLPAVGDVYTMSIERVGQAVTVTVTCGERTVSTTYYDFDLFARDGGYMYVGMFANRGTVVEFTDVSLEITGTSQGA